MMKYIFFIAIMLRVFLMSSTYHRDLAGQSVTTNIFARQNIFNIYEHLASLPPEHPISKNFGTNSIFIYPPLAYFTLGLSQKLLSFTGINNFILKLTQGEDIYQITNFRYYLFVLKFPYLVFDLLSLYFITKLFTKRQNRNRVAIFWLFNPINLYATYMMGVFDIIPVFFTILSIYLFKKNLFLWSAFCLGIGVTFKSYPLFLVPFLVFSQPNLLSRLKVALAAIIPIVLVNLPFISSLAYRNMVYGHENQKMLFMQFPLSGAERIFPFIFIYSLLVLYSKDLYHHLSKMNLYFLGFFLILFSVTHYHPQWMVWVSPFIIINLVSTRLKYIWHYLILLSIFTVITLLFENSLSIGLFAPLDIRLNDLPQIATVLATKIDIFLLKSYLRSIFAAVCLYIFLKQITSTSISPKA